MATSTDGQRAHGILLTYAPLSKHGYCWYYVWQAYAAAGASTGMGSTPTAYAAWNVTWGRHPGDRNPPPGAAIWLGRRYSDGNMSGDVFIAGQYDGDHAATDYPGWGDVGRVSIQGRINLTGREYLGWSDHVLDCPIITKGDDTLSQAEVDAINANTNTQADLTRRYGGGAPGTGAWLVRYAKSDETGNVFALYKNPIGGAFRCQITDATDLAQLGDVFVVAQSELWLYDIVIDDDGVPDHPGVFLRYARSEATGNVFALYEDARGNRARYWIEEPDKSEIGRCEVLPQRELWGYAPINQATP